MTVSCKRGHSFQSGIKTSSRDNHSLLYNLDRTVLQNKQNDGMTTLGALTPELLTNSLLSTKEEPSKLKKKLIEIYLDKSNDVGNFMFLCLPQPESNAASSC